MCEFRYTKNDDTPTCPFLKFEQCPYAWWCTHDHVWKEYEGVDKCGLRLKMFKEGWHPVKEQQSDGCIVFLWGKKGEPLTTPPTKMYDKLPAFIKVGENYTVVDELFD